MFQLFLFLLKAKSFSIQAKKAMINSREVEVIMKKKTGIFFALLALLVLGTACNKKDDSKTSASSYAKEMKEEPYSDEEFLLGTYVRIRVYDKGKEKAIAPAMKRIKKLGDKITINQSGSEIDALNAQAGKKPVKVSKDIYGLLKQAYKYSDESKGGFNMAIGAITQLWRIGFSDARKPAQSEIDEALKHIDYHKIKFNDEKQTVYLEEKGMIVDLGAIAKGYIADEAVAVLKKYKVRSAVVDLGGNVFVVGHSNRGIDQDWNVGVQDPNKARGSILGSIKEADKTIVTSGIYERYLEVDGKKYHHIFDSKTGYPYDNDIASATIITDKSIDGDGLTTVIFDKGIKKGLEYVENQTPKGTSAIFVTRENKVYVTNDIKKSFKLNKEAGYKLGDRSELK